MEKFLAQFRALPTWQRLTLLIGLPLIGTIYIWMMLVSPSADEVNRLKADIQNMRAEIQTLKTSARPETLKNLLAEEKALQDELKNKELQLSAIVGEIPTEKDMSIIVRNIGLLAKRLRITILSMQMSQPQAVTFALYDEGGKKIVKEIQQQNQQQTPDQQGQQASPAQGGVSFLRSELKLSIIGNYENIKKFMERLGVEGTVSYPVSVSLSGEGNNLRAEIVIHIIIKEGKEQ